LQTEQPVLTCKTIVTSILWVDAFLSSSDLSSGVLQVGQEPLAAERACERVIVAILRDSR